MDSTEIASEERTNLGTIKIADDVVKVVAGLAAMDIKGVAGMSGGFAGGIAELLGRKNLSRGIKVEVGEKEAAPCWSSAFYPLFLLVWAFLQSHFHPAEPIPRERCNLEDQNG